MDWTPEAKAAIKKVPPFVRKMAQKAVESHAKKRNMATVTLEIVQETRMKLMGRPPEKRKTSAKKIHHQGSMWA